MQSKLRDNWKVYPSRMKVRLRKPPTTTKQADKREDGQQTNCLILTALRTIRKIINLGSPFSRKAGSAGFSVLCAVIIFLSLACGDAERTTNIVTAPEDAAKKLPMGEGLDLGALAPEFSLPDGDGEFHSLSEHRGQKLVIVFYRTGT